MHHDLTLVVNITMALLAAFVGGYIARRIGMPTLVGYLLGGLAIGPFTPGFVGDIASVSQLAEMGVIFMLFGVGLHFSLKDLWAVRKVAIPGAVLQIVLATALGYGLTQLWGWTTAASLVVGLAISVASTVVLLRGLVDNGLLNTVHGQTAVGWLILEDLATVIILVLLPVMFGSSHANPWLDAGWTIAKTGVFVAVMLFVGKKVMPWILLRTAYTRSRELFILAVITLALGTALGAALFFDVSLALGAFLAGVVIGESDLSHQVGAEVLPFREIFAAIFFVSVGMLVNPAAVVANAGQVLALTALIVLGKGLLTVLLGFVLPSSGRTILVVAAGLGQIGEFSFLVGQAGLSLGVMNMEQYGLILAAALLSIIINPLLFHAIPWTERQLQRLPGLWRRLDHHIAPPALPEGLSDHVVVVGYGRVGTYTVNVLERLDVPILVIEQDMQRAVEFDKRGVPTLAGDAANSEILTHAHLDTARSLVVTIADETAAELVVAAARAMAPDLRIIARERQLRACIRWSSSAPTMSSILNWKAAWRSCAMPCWRLVFRWSRCSSISTPCARIPTTQPIPDWRRYTCWISWLPPYGESRLPGVQWRQTVPWPAAHWPRQTFAHIPAPPLLRSCAITRCRPTRNQVRCSRRATWSA